jgi:pentatricopeptide repeat protein
MQLNYLFEILAYYYETINISFVLFSTGVMSKVVRTVKFKRSAATPISPIPKHKLQIRSSAGMPRDPMKVILSGSPLTLPDFSHPAKSVFNESAELMERLLAHQRESLEIREATSVREVRKKRKKDARWSEDGLVEKKENQGIIVDISDGKEQKKSVLEEEIIQDSSRMLPVVESLITLIEQKIITDSKKNQPMHIGSLKSLKKSKFGELLSFECLTVEDLQKSNMLTLPKCCFLIRSLSAKYKISKDKKSEYLELAFSVPDGMIKNGIQPDVDIFTELALLSPNAEMVRNVFLKMRSLLVPATPKMYGALIQSHLTDKTCVDKLSAAFSLVDKMEMEGIPVSVEIHTMLIQGLLKYSSPQAAIEYFNNSRSWKGLLPDTNLFNVLIRAAAVSGEAEKALSFFEDLKLSNLSPNEYTYSNLMMACAVRADFAHKTFEFQTQMECEELPLTRLNAEALLRASASLGSVPKLKTVVEFLNAKNLGFSSKFYSLAIDTVSKAMLLNNVSLSEKISNLRVVWALVTDAKTKKFPVTSKMLNSVMTAYKNGKFHEHAIKVLDEFDRFGCSLTSKTMEILFGIFYEMKDTGRFFALLFDDSENPLIAQAIQVNPKILNLALDLAMDSKSGKKTVDVLTLMKSSSIFPTPQQAEKLANVGKKVVDIHLAVSALISKQKQKVAEEVRVRNKTVDLNISEYQATLAVEAKSIKDPSKHQQSRNKFFEKLKKITGGNNRPFLPLKKYHELTKRGGELYEKKQRPKFNQHLFEGSR